MTTFYIKYRKTTPVLVATVEANSVERAITDLVAAAEEGEQVEVLSSTVDALEAGAENGGATGPSGTSGTSGTSGASGAARSR